MRALNIMGSLIFIQLAIAMVNYANIIPGNPIGGYMGQDIATALIPYQPSTSETTSYGILNLMAFVGFLIQSILFFVFLIGYTTVLLPALLQQLGLPLLINGIVTTGVWMSYIIDYNEYRARMRTMSG